MYRSAQEIFERYSSLSTKLLNRISTLLTIFIYPSTNACGNKEEFLFNLREIQRLLSIESWTEIELSNLTSCIELITIDYTQSTLSQYKEEIRSIVIDLRKRQHALNLANDLEMLEWNAKKSTAIELPSAVHYVIGSDRMNTMEYKVKRILDEIHHALLASVAFIQDEKEVTGEDVVAELDICATEISHWIETRTPINVAQSDWADVDETTYHQLDRLFVRFHSYFDRMKFHVWRSKINEHPSLIRLFLALSYLRNAIQSKWEVISIPVCAMICMNNHLNARVKRLKEENQQLEKLIEFWNVKKL